MPRFKKKPIIITAEEFTKDKQPEGIYIDKSSKTGYSIDTLEGKHEVTLKDWIITGIKGERYPIKPDIFAETYSPVIGVEAHVDQLILDNPKQEEFVIAEEIYDEFAQLYPPEEGVQLVNKKRVTAIRYNGRIFMRSSK